MTAAPHSLDWYLEEEARRYRDRPWMPDVMEFDRHTGQEVLEIDAGAGTDLCQYARHGARVTDADADDGRLTLAQENMRLRELTGRFVCRESDRLPFDDASFDVVMSSQALDNALDTGGMVEEIHRVLRPAGRVIVTAHAENSLHYWRNLVWDIGLKGQALAQHSMAEILSRAELAGDGEPGRVRVFTKSRLRRLFARFVRVEIVQRQFTAPELPRLLAGMPLGLAERLMGRTLVLKANKAAR